MSDKSVFNELITRFIKGEMGASELFHLLKKRKIKVSIGDFLNEVKNHLAFQRCMQIVLMYFDVSRFSRVPELEKLLVENKDQYVSLFDKEFNPSRYNLLTSIFLNDNDFGFFVNRFLHPMNHYVFSINDCVIIRQDSDFKKHISSELVPIPELEYLIKEHEESLVFYDLIIYKKRSESFENRLRDVCSKRADNIAVHAMKRHYVELSTLCLSAQDAAEILLKF